MLLTHNIDEISGCDAVLDVKVPKVPVTSWCSERNLIGNGLLLDGCSKLAYKESQVDAISGRAATVISARIFLRFGFYIRRLSLMIYEYPNHLPSQSQPRQRHIHA